MPGRVVPAVLLSLGALALGWAPARAQDAGEVRSRCVEMGGDADRCTRAAVGARALMGEVGLASGLGSEIPGSPSPLGRKIGNRPRLSTSLRVAASGASLPDVFHAGPGPATEARSFVLPSIHLGLAAGLLDGFSPLPTVGGFLSLDAFASLSFVTPPSGEGFDGSATGLSFGLRAGLLRESFTLPGIAVSVSRRYAGDVRLGDAALGDPADISVDPAVTSVRATVGKDLFGVGVLGGVGWDFHSADTLIRLGTEAAAPLELASSMDARRTIYFGSAALSFLLLQLSLEGGWAAGFERVPGAAGEAFDSGQGSAFGSLAVRFTP
jgi:hypothetical protein